MCEVGWEPQKPDTQDIVDDDEYPEILPCPVATLLQQVPQLLHVPFDGVCQEIDFSLLHQGESTVPQQSTSHDNGMFSEADVANMRQAGLCCDTFGPLLQAPFKRSPVSPSGEGPWRAVPRVTGGTPGDGAPQREPMRVPIPPPLLLPVCHSISSADEVLEILSPQLCLELSERLSISQKQGHRSRLRRPP